MTQLPNDYLDEILNANLRGDKRGLPSLCSSHPVVLETAFFHAQSLETPLLIESTCNQVNQFGGYTGQTPEMFSTYLSDMAAQLGFSRDSLILGGDHLGPEVWQGEPTVSAMEKAKGLVKACVAAGYTKIHLDASMKLGDDPSGPLAKNVAAARSAELALVAEQTAASIRQHDLPRYVIGTEVPFPGGAYEADDEILITSPDEVAETIELTRQAFYSLGLESGWDRVIAVVVQPGVEYGDDFIIPYQREAAAGLSKFIEGQELAYEAHSTDYQQPGALRQMVADHFAILKVGPALTFAYREAIFALAMMEAELIHHSDCSKVMDVLDNAMIHDPQYWVKYYHGDEKAQKLARKYSLSDRSRYYWPVREVQAAVSLLMKNLTKYPPSLSLISQFMPDQYGAIQKGKIRLEPYELVRHKVTCVLADYHTATATSITD